MGHYTAVITDHNGCTASASTDIINPTLPLPEITGPQSKCDASGAQMIYHILNYNPSYDVDYHWTAIDAIHDATVNINRILTAMQHSGCQVSSSSRMAP